VTASPPAVFDPLDTADEAVVCAVDGEMAEAARRAGPLFGCGPGRTDCCRGPFPINLLDARRLQRSLAALEHREPARAEAVRARAAATVARLGPSFPGGATNGLLRGETIVAFALAGLPPVSDR
jgi:hypothetical protein